MSRRERFIRQTDDELRRLEEAHIAKQKLLESRKGLIAKTLRTKCKDSLVQLLTKLCDENIHARWTSSPLCDVSRRATAIAAKALAETQSRGEKNRLDP